MLDFTWNSTESRFYELSLNWLHIDIAHSLNQNIKRKQKKTTQKKNIYNIDRHRHRYSCEYLYRQLWNVCFEFLWNTGHNLEFGGDHWLLARTTCDLQCDEFFLFRQIFVETNVSKSETTKEIHKKFRIRIRHSKRSKNEEYLNVRTYSMKSYAISEYSAWLCAHRHQNRCAANANLFTCAYNRSTSVSSIGWPVPLE